MFTGDSKDFQAPDQVWIALASFLVLAVTGWVLGWSVGDLLWGLLLVSLLACVIAVGLGVASIWRVGWKNVRHEHWPRRVYLLQTPVLVAVALALMFGCVFFHFIYGFVIYFLAPLWPEVQSSFDLEQDRQGRILLEAAARYWPFAVLSVAADWRRLLQPIWDPQQADIARPWNLILRMHLFIFAAIGVVVLTGDSGFALYLVVLLFFFFPWRSVVQHLRHREPATRP